MPTTQELDKMLVDIQNAVRDHSQERPNADLHLVEALQTMQLAVEGPLGYLSRIRLQPLLNVALFMAIESGILEVIVKKKGGTVTAKALSGECKFPESFIGRIMRLLVVCGFCEEVTRQTYRSNKLGEIVNGPGPRGGVRTLVQIMFPIAGNLVKYMRTPEFCEFPDAPGATSAFKFAHGAPMWELLGQNPELKEGFDAHMAARREAAIARPWFEVYPAAVKWGPGAKREPDAVMMVDVAGGTGHDISDLRNRYPELPGRFVLQDLPETLARCPGLNGVEKLEYDFFTEQPIKGARAYFFRGICHDWSDTRCRTILSNTIKAMDRDYSKIILEDLVLPDDGASVRSASVDILMMMMTTGIERTRSQWRNLLDSVGLEITGIFGEEEGFESIIEARLKPVA